MIVLKSISLISLFLLSFIASGMAQVDNCMTCHQEMEDDYGPSHKFVKDIHFQQGLHCYDCHGGDPTLEDMEDVYKSSGFIGVPDHFEVPQFCARCHSNADYMRDHNPALPVDQLDKYKTSVHGQRLFKNKDKKVANCISCHTVHEIGDAKLPHSSTHPLNLPQTCGNCHANIEYMAEYNIPTDQLDDYKQSVHGIALLEHKDLGAPACNDCHGNHGASPPGVSSLSAVCGMCHAIEAQLFNASRHRPAFEENDFPMCETCHSNHKIVNPSDEMIGSKEPALCVQCHAADDGTEGLVTADSVKVMLNRLLSARDTANVILKDAMHKGMMTTDEEFLMKEVDQTVIQTRTQIHSFNIDSLIPKAEAGIQKADSTRINSAKLIDEYYFRRKGLGVATIIITLLAFVLYRRIKLIEKNK